LRTEISAREGSDPDILALFVGEFFADVKGIFALFGN